MPISNVPYSSFNKYTIQTGAGNYNLPQSDVDALYGPGWPIAPVTMPDDSDLPRVVDYPVGINYTLQPRVGYEGLMPISALRAAYANVAEVAAPVNLLIRELTGFTPILQNVKTKQKAKDGHPYEWMTLSPDRKVPFNVWISRYKKSAKVYAAPAFYKKRDGNNIIAMEYIDGSTFFLIVNERGELPEPNQIDPNLSEYLNQVSSGNVSGLSALSEMGFTSGRVGKRAKTPDGTDVTDRFVKFELKEFLQKARERRARGLALPTTTPAFTQIIKGVPFSFWDKNQVYFQPEPPAPAMDSPYGETYIERSYAWIQVVAVLTAFELGHYRTGNMPEGWATLPKDLFPTIGKITAYERVYNARMAESSQVAHSRIRFGPEGMKWIQTKKETFPKELYQQARNNILYAIGMPPSEMGDKPGSGLGGKGFAEGAETDIMRQILETEKESIEDAFNAVLIEEGVDDVRMYLDYPTEQINPEKQSEDLISKFQHGVLSLNDVLTAQHREPIGSVSDKDNIANMHLIISGSQVFVIEKEEFLTAGSGAPQAGGSPLNPEDSLPQPAPGAKGLQDAKRMARVIEEQGGKKATVKKIFVAAGAPGNPEDVLQVPAGINPEAWNAGIKEETEEHGESLGGNMQIIATLVEDHLRQNPDYYKKVDITDHDGAMVALMIPMEVSEKLRFIADVIGLPANARQELAENMHVTMAFFPDFQERDKDKVLAGLNMIGAQFAPISGKIQGYGVFNGSNGEKVLYATLDGVDIPFIRTAICEFLDNNGIEYGKDHGFVPHITMAYIPEDWQLPKGFEVTDIEGVFIDKLTLVIGDQKYDVNLTSGDPIQKHCGVCEEDSLYFGAPVTMDGGDQVIMSPEGAIPDAVATWRPEGAEDIEKRTVLGGALYKREEAAFLLDQSLEFQLVPVAYVSEVNGEHGAVVWKLAGEKPAKPAYQYFGDWVEKAGVLDYIMGRSGDYVTHPDEEGRMILINNGDAFPEVYSKKTAFVDAISNRRLSKGVLEAISACLGDFATWTDIKDLIGSNATEEAISRANSILANEGIYGTGANK